MSKFELHSSNLDLTDALEQYAIRKVNRAIKHNKSFVSKVKINLIYENRPNSCMVEIIAFLIGGKTVRNYSSSDDMYASIDIASAGIDRQLRKLKEKHLTTERHRILELKESPDFIAAIAS
ncbi:MAG: ribosome-associated translation inhibitor RaiA [Candidatus Caenarcaniphilales bacterium]|nr:ribosome-associated translation inhibitor RaiA [Candidatus Caenarcaniphilales bacterium]